MTRSARPTPTRLLGLAALLCLAHPAAAAEGPPVLDVEATCKSSMRAQSSVSGTATVEGCLRSEDDARKEAQRRWGDYSAAAKKQCGQQFKAGGSPSYVEMVTCLELASGTVPTQSGDAGSGGKVETNKGPSSATAPADPNQRTDPIEVLNRK